MAYITRLKLAKKYNQGIYGGILYTVDDKGTVTVFNLTGYSVFLEIYQEDGTVLCTINGQVDDATNGVYSIIPYVSDNTTNMTTFEGLADGEYYYRIKVTSPSYLKGRLFDTDSNGRPLRCKII